AQDSSVASGIHPPFSNCCEPITDSSGSLTIDDTGNLVLFSGQNDNNKRVLVWSTNSSKQAREPLVQLLDNVNLVLRDEMGLEERTAFVVVNTIRPSEFMRDNNTALLVSKGGKFELGFFTPTDSSSNNRYLGIWYKNIAVQTIVWVANRCEPIIDSSALQHRKSCAFSGKNNKSVLIWSTNSSKQAREPLVQLLDYGNLVLRDEKDANTTKFLWESFDYPTDTMLPEMKLGWDLKRGLNRRLSSWKSSDDPCHGDFTYGIELDEPHHDHTYPQLFIRNGSAKLFREAPWEGISFSGDSSTGYVSVYWYSGLYNFVNNDDEVYYNFSLLNGSNIVRLVLTETVEYTEWLEEENNKCDKYGICGANSECIITNNQVCKCLEGFNPKNQENWNSMMSWSEGCVRNSSVSCDTKEKDVLLGFSGLKVPDSQYIQLSKSVNQDECKAKCLSNCSCMAYSYTESDEGSDCVLWFGDLFDIRQLSSDGQTVYIRIPFSTKGKKTYVKFTIPKMNHEKARSDHKKVVILVAVTVGLAGVFISIAFYILRRRHFNGNSLFTLYFILSIELSNEVSG
ncbi:hypothetical protein F8388_001084, partial [Cannabis sativa]